MPRFKVFEAVILRQIIELSEEEEKAESRTEHHPHGFRVVAGSLFQMGIELLVGVQEVVLLSLV